MTRLVDVIVKLRTVWATLLALALGGVLILASGADPLAAYGALFHGAFFDYWGLSSTLVKASPILLAALAVIVPLRAGLYNIGGEGQIYMGGLFATLAGLSLPPLHPVPGIALVVLAAMVGGALWAAVAGLLKAFRGINEVIVTLLMNFIAIHIVSYAVSGPLLAEGAPYPYSEELPAWLRLPILMPQSDAHAGILFGLVFSVFIAFYFTRTSHGLALDIIGRNPKAAQYAGLSVRRDMVIAMMAGGALAGLAGGLEVIGLKYRLFHLFSPGYGFDGIVVAFMAEANPLLAPLAAFFLSGLKAGSNIMQRAAGVDGTIVEVIRGLVVMFVAAGLAWKFHGSSVYAFLQARRKAANHSIGAADP
ncbi:MAG: ABC transporter permease [Rhizobiales bacterium]|nr:ABC transporter permease [Hyphomicrobiales bacterium]